MAESSNKGYIATVGFFDGVHRGHRFLIDQLIEIARGRGMDSMVITFAEHPRQVLDTQYRPLLLSTPEDKISMLQSCGTDACKELHFTKELSLLDAKDFMHDVLRDRLGVKVLLMGHDHCFGHDCIKDFCRYKEIGEELGIEVLKASPLIYEDAPVSSSRIRRCLAEGLAGKAADMLGYPYSVSGKVVHGLQNGRKMGFPTANLGPYNPFMQIPANGVYAAWATVGGKRYMSMLNIGFRPTIEESGRRTIEAHLLDFDNDIYGLELQLQFISYIRAEHRFESMAALAEQLSADKDMARQILGHL